MVCGFVVVLFPLSDFMTFVFYSEYLGKAPMAEWLWCQAENLDDLDSIPRTVRLTVLTISITDL